MRSLGLLLLDFLHIVKRNDLCCFIYSSLPRWQLISTLLDSMQFVLMQLQHCAAQVSQLISLPHKDVKDTAGSRVFVHLAIQ